MTAGTVTQESQRECFGYKNDIHQWAVKKRSRLRKIV
jgi:hypothetical protein